MKNMTLGIDASRYGHPESTGVEWYSYHLLNELIPLLGREHNTRILLYGQHDFRLLQDAPFNVKKRIIPFRKFWTLLRLSYEMVRHPVDKLFVPSHYLPFFAPKKSVITIHDIAFRHLKTSYSPLQYALLNWSTKKAVKKAWRIITPSEATKRDLIKLFGCDPEKIFVVPHGAPYLPPLRNWTEKEKNDFMQHFGLGGSSMFVLYVGRIETKKNLPRLIEGFRRLLTEFPDWKLVLAGKKGVGFEEVEAKIRELGMEKQVIMPGYVTEKQKEFLLDACRIVAFPSLYEGFGLPVLEGFVHRRPVLTSKTSSLPEVAGNAAYLVNPEEAIEIGVGLKRLAADGILVSQLISKGDKRLHEYSWEKAAKQTFEVLFGD